MTQERVAYINGDYLPESEVKVSFRDRGFVLGDAVFDTARTFEGKIFRLDDHIDRLYRSLNHMLLQYHQYMQYLHLLKPHH